MNFLCGFPLAEKVPYLGSREVVDVVQFYFCGSMGKAKFLVQAAVLINVPGNLLLDILLAAIYLVSNCCPKVNKTFHPWKWVATQEHVRKLSFLGKECHTLSLALFWVSKLFCVLVFIFPGYFFFSPCKSIIFSHKTVAVNKIIAG